MHLIPDLLIFYERKLKIKKNFQKTYPNLIVFNRDLWDPKLDRMEQIRPKSVQQVPSNLREKNIPTQPHKHFLRILFLANSSVR